MYAATRSSTLKMLRDRFDAARAARAKLAEKDGNMALAARGKKFKFLDIRAKAASEIVNLEDACKLFEHTTEQVTQKAYRGDGKVVKRTR